MYRQGDGEIWEHLTEPRAVKQRTAKQKLDAQKIALAAEQWRLRNHVLPDNAGNRDKALRTKGLKKIELGRPRVLHFRWKRFRLTLCLGGTAIAAWPGADDGFWLALIQTKMIGKHAEPLSQDQTKIRRMVLRLRETLVKAEEGTRRKSAVRQRARLDQLFKLGVYAPAKNQRVKVTWRCSCGGSQVYALSVESCQWCHKKAPRQRRLKLPDNSR